MQIRFRAAVAVIVVAASMAVVSAPASAAPTERPTANSATYTKSISTAIKAIQTYWAKTFPDLYGAKYSPIATNRIFAGHPGVKFPSCQGQQLGYSDVKDNAFYCFKDNFVAYDDTDLFPALYKQYGPFSIALVLAHEWGHAIQDRAQNTPGQPAVSGIKTVYKELQADCFAGAFTVSLDAKGSPIKLGGGDLENALAALLKFRDVPGASPEDASAHGSAFDRINAFQECFESGPSRCQQYFASPPTIVQFPFQSKADAASNGNVPAADVIPLTLQLLNQFYSAVEPRYQPLATSNFKAFDSSKASTIPTCGGTKLSVSQVKDRVFFCIDDKYIGFDQPFLQSIYDNIGDFGVSSLIASAWATYVQTIQGIKGVQDNTLEAVMQADCYTGGWTAAFYNGYLNGSISPGDLDEFVQAFLVYSRARGVKANVPITFVRVKFFRQGFFSGYSSCDIASITAAVAKL